MIQTLTMKFCSGIQSLEKGSQKTKVFYLFNSAFQSFHLCTIALCRSSLSGGLFFQLSIYLLDDFYQLMTSFILHKITLRVFHRFHCLTNDHSVSSMWFLIAQPDNLTKSCWRTSWFLMSSNWIFLWCILYINNTNGE